MQLRIVVLRLLAVLRFKPNVAFFVTVVTKLTFLATKKKWSIVNS